MVTLQNPSGVDQAWAAQLMKLLIINPAEHVWFRGLSFFSLPEPIAALFQALESWDLYSAQHSVRVTQISLRFAHYLGLPLEVVRILGTAGYLHDIGKMRQIENFKRQMLQADLSWNPGTFLSLACLMSGVGFFLGQVWASFLVSFALALTLGLLPFLFLRWKKARKTNRFERQMPDALELFSRSLRAGHTLAAAIDLVSREVSPPWDWRCGRPTKSNIWGSACPRPYRI